MSRPSASGRGLLVVLVLVLAVLVLGDLMRPDSFLGSAFERILNGDAPLERMLREGLGDPPRRPRPPGR